MAGSLTATERLTARLQGAAAAGMTGLPRPVVRLLAGRAFVRDGQRLEPEAQLLLRLHAATGAAHVSSLTVAQARRHVSAEALSAQGGRPDSVPAEPVAITGGPVPLQGRLYVPVGPATDTGLLIFFHGGGFVVGSLDSHDHLCRWLAVWSGARILSVEYRLGPENRFPAAVEDAWAAYEFAVGHADKLGAEGRPLAVGGDSAGGNLAAGVAQRAARSGATAPALQVLLYPWLDLSRRRRSHELFGHGFYLHREDLDWYGAHYLSAPEDAGNPRCSPALVERLEGLCPAYIATAGFDPLRDEAEEYARRLRAAGVAVALARHAGLVHGFASVLGFGRVGREALAQTAGALRLALEAAARGRSPLV